LNAEQVKKRINIKIKILRPNPKENLFQRFNFLAMSFPLKKISFSYGLLFWRLVEMLVNILDGN